MALGGRDIPLEKVKVDSLGLERGHGFN